MSYWLETTTLPQFHPLKNPISVDVAVIGGGITGITSAYLLSEAGLKVALLERGRLGTVDTGHTTAHLTYVTDKRLPDLAKELGTDSAKALWDIGKDAINEIERIASTENIECELRRVPGYLISSLDGPVKETTNFQDDVELAKQLGFDADTVSSVQPFNRDGIRFHGQGKFHPRKYLKGLIESIIRKGGLFYEMSDVKEISHNPPSVETEDGTVFCKKIVVATHNPHFVSDNFLKANAFQSKLALYSSYVIGASVPAGIIAEGCYWDISDPYYYLRVDSCGDRDYLIFGGKDKKTGQGTENEEPFNQLNGVLKRFFPEAILDNRWSGQVIETTDNVPYIGAVNEEIFVSTGYSGNGMTFATAGAMMARDWVVGLTNRWSELVKVDRVVPLNKVGRYLNENSDFPFYALKDRATGNETISLDSLEPGEGGVTIINGNRVAAFRDVNGIVHLLSPVCTHMGCIVRWNSTDRTWDCPCHGSRFKGTGEVLAGPALHALQSFDEDEKSQTIFGN